MDHRPVGLHRSKYLQSQFQTSVLVWIQSVITGAWLLSTTVYAWSLTTNSGSLLSIIPSSPARSVAILQILNGGTTFLLAHLMGLTLETVVWAFASSSDGITVASFLGASSCTGIFGLLELLRWKKTPVGKDHHRIWVINRLLFYVLGFFMGVIILTTIDPGVNFNPTAPMFSVSAGIGPFNLSLAEQWDSWVLSTYLVTRFPTFLVDSAVSYPTSYAASHPPCVNNTRTCHSNYFPGVLSIVSPWAVGVKFNESLDADTFIVNHEQGVHVDYWEVDQLEGNWTTEDCRIWGNNNSALMICLSTSKVTKNALVAGLATCNFQNPAFQNGCLNDLSWSSNSNDSTSFAFYTQTANVAYSLSNYSILSISDISEASPAEPILPSDLFPLLDKFFSPVNSSGPITELSLTDTLINYLYFDNYNPSVFGGTYYFQSILTWPVISFQANDMNYNKPAIDDEPIPGLPDELYVTGQFAQSVNRIFISKSTVVLFISIGGGIYIWCLAWLAWATTIDNPGFGHFPIMDFASRIASAGVCENSAVNVMGSLTGASRSGVRQRLKNVRLFLGDVNREENRFATNLHGIEEVQRPKIGFSTRNFEVMEMSQGG